MTRKACVYQNGGEGNFDFNKVKCVFVNTCPVGN